MKDMDAMMPTYGGHCTFWWSLLELAENRRNGWFSVLLAVSGKSMFRRGACMEIPLYDDCEGWVQIEKDDFIVKHWEN